MLMSSLKTPCKYLYHHRICLLLAEFDWIELLEGAMQIGISIALGFLRSFFEGITEFFLAYNDALHQSNTDSWRQRPSYMAGIHPYNLHFRVSEQVESLCYGSNRHRERNIDLKVTNTLYIKFFDLRQVSLHRQMELRLGIHLRIHFPQFSSPCP